MADKYEYREQEILNRIFSEEKQAIRVVRSDDSEIPGGGSGGSGGDVNITDIGGVDITLGQKAMAASFPVVLASDQSAIPISHTALTELAAAIDTELQVDIIGALPAGTNAIGKLAANSGVDIGDVDILSIAAGDNNIGNVDIVTVPADPFGVNADAAATAGGTGSIQAKLRNLTSTNDSIKTAVETIDNAIAGSEMQVDVVAALPAGTNAIGKLTANSGVDIGDVDVLSIVPGTGATNLGKAEDAGHTTGDTGVYILGVRNDTPNTALTNADADYGSIALYKTGAVRTAIPEEDFAVLGSNHVKKYYTSSGAVTDGIVWSPAAGKRWYVTDIVVNVSAACTVTFEDDKAGGDEAVAKFEFAANSGWGHSFNTPWFSGEDAADLLVTTTAGNIYIAITGYEI